jgi:mannose-1-phosphate guanylyltransferase/mannose-6-phosphate isomerase
MREVQPFVLCGGAGTRLWPLSREAFPKQFHRVAGSETLFQQTWRRFSGDLFEPPCVLSNRTLRFLVAEQLDELGVARPRIVLEPASRNTAPAACVAALLAAQNDPAALVLLAPCDHVIPDVGAFTRAVAAGIEAAKGGALVTFGAEPDCPHPGYGYLEVGPANGSDLPVRRFVEKPTQEAAQAFLASGDFYWNAGIFLFSAARLLELMQEQAPDILRACRSAVADATEDLGFIKLGAAYEEAPSISIDYAIAEKIDNIRCVPLRSPWSDVGSWSAVWDLFPKDEFGNALHGEGEIFLRDTRNSFAYSEEACVALIGLDNVVVVATGDAVLVAAKDQVDRVREIVAQLKGNGAAHVLHHNRVYRPWGWYQTVNRGERYQVKCLMVKPGAMLSLQSHYHRSEHWVVVRGTLEVTKGQSTELLSENQSTYIPIGSPHRLANPGKIPAFLIEVQSGSYLAEDDIVRFEEIYGRSANE